MKRSVESGEAGQRPLDLRWEAHNGRLVRCPAQRPAGIHAMFLEAAASNPDAIALVDGDMRLTYQELDERTSRCAGRLAASGLVRGDRVAILLGNRADFICLLLACSRLGLVSVPLNIRHSGPEIAHIVADSGAGVLFAETELIPRVEAVSPPLACLNVIAVDDARPVWACDDPAVSQAVVVEEDDPCCLVYTSGTTGKPKGAVLTHFGIVANCMGAAEALDLRAGESVVLAVPLSHVTGLVLIVFLTLRLAGKIIVMRQFKASAFLELAERERMTYTIMVPAMYKLCLMEPDLGSRKLAHWRSGAFGGAPMPEATIDALAEWLPGLSLFNIYGATETTAPAVVMPSSEIRSRLSQVGRPLPQCEILIIDDAGREVPAGQTGELWIAGPMVVPRYWNNDAATASEFVGGFWKSGDIGMYDRDGFLSISDRRKDVINRGGFKIYSIEIENTVMRDEAVVEAAAVPYSCPVLGERIALFIVLKNGAEPGDLRALCREWLADYKIPDRLEVVPGPLPRNANGKLLKREIREWVIPQEQGSILASPGGNRGERNA